MLPCCTDGLCIGDLSEDIKDKPYKVFLNDLMFLLCQECKVPWQTLYECAYAIHPRSPLCSDIRCYVRNSYGKMYAHVELSCLRKYEEEIEREEKEDATLIRICNDELKRRRSRLFNFLIHQDMYDVFMEILQTALSCITFYGLGMTDAVFFGVTEMIQVFEEYFKKTGRSFASILHRISCLVAKLPHDNWPSNMIDELHKVFTRDLLYFMCSLHEIPWHPPNCEKYSINTKSPLTLDIQIYIEKSLPSSESTFYLIYSYYRNKESVFKAFSIGVLTIMKEISNASISQVKSVEDLFLLVLNTARMSIELHEHRLSGGIKLIYQQLPDALRKCNEMNNSRIFDLFNAFAKLENEKKHVLGKAKPLDPRFFLNLGIF